RGDPGAGHAVLKLLAAQQGRADATADSVIAGRGAATRDGVSRGSPLPRTRTGRQRKGHHVAATLRLADLGLTDTLHLVDAHYGVQRDEAAVDAFELVLELFLARVDQHLRTLAKHQLLDLEKAPQLALEDLAG